MQKERKTDRKNLPPILKRYFDYMVPRKSPDTIETYLYRVLDFHKFMQQKLGKSLGQLRQADVEAYVNELVLRKEGGKISQNTIKQNAHAVKMVAKWLLREEIIDSKEYQKIEEDVREIPEERGEDNRKALSDEEIDQVHKRLADPLLQMLLWTGENFGLRRLEYCRLLVHHLELDGERPRLKIERSKGHNKKTRYIPLFHGQVTQWRKWLLYRASLNLSHSFVFYNPRKPSMGLLKDALSHLFAKMSKITGVHLYPHRLRYTYAVRLWKHGVNIYIISLLLGHENIETTIRYLKIREEDFWQKFMAGARGLLH